MPEKIIRDPVHDIIAFRLENPIEALLFKLVGAREFQRLHRIRQLGMAYLAYPGADHSRYSHSLGVMETARKILQRIQLTRTINDSSLAAALCAAMLHDLGHGPLSHVFEEISGVDHEKQTASIILNPDSDVHRILADHDRALPQTVVNFLAGKSKEKFFSDILSSQLDADRFDYLLRDNHMTGSHYGGFDLRWLLHALVVDERTTRLAVTARGLSAVETYLQARHHMYRNVYFHKVVRTAEGMMKLALRRARRLAEQDRLPGLTRDDSTFRALVGGSLTNEEFTELDDVSLTQCIKLWTKSDDPILARLCDGLLYRRLFKTIDISHVEDESDRSAALARAAAAIESAGGDVDYNFFYDQPSDTPFEIYDGQNPARDIPIQLPDGSLKSFSELSPLTSVLSRQLMFRRLHVAPEYRDVVQRAVLGKK